MALTNDELARLQRLRLRRDQLIDGTALRSAQSGTRKSEFGQGDPEALRIEIEGLEAKAALPSGKARAGGAIRFRL